MGGVKDADAAADEDTEAAAEAGGAAGDSCSTDGSCGRCSADQTGVECSTSSWIVSNRPTSEDGCIAAVAGMPLVA